MIAIVVYDNIKIILEKKFIIFKNIYIDKLS